jgi:hypothetical protein
MNFYYLSKLSYKIIFYSVYEESAYIISIEVNNGKLESFS